MSPIHLAEALTKRERKSETTVGEVQPDMMSNIVRVEKSKTLPLVYYNNFTKLNWIVEP